MACRSLLTSELSATRRHYLELSTLEVHPPTKTKSLSRAVPRGMVLSPSRQLSNCHFKVSKNSGNCLLRTDAGDKIIIVKVKYSSRKRSCLGACMAHQLKVERSKLCGHQGQQKPLSERFLHARISIFTKREPQRLTRASKNHFQKMVFVCFYTTGYPCAWVSFKMKETRVP